MIHTVRIPQTVSRLGCSPGSDCCDDCRNHRPRIGDTVCDDSGNCYTDGVLTAAPLTTGFGCKPGEPSCPRTLLLIGGGILAAAFLMAQLAPPRGRR